MRKFLLFALFLSLTLFLDTNFSIAEDLPTVEPFLEKGVVTKVLSEKHDKELEKLFNSEQIIQILNIKILSGELKDKEFKVKNYLTNNPEYDIKIKQGDRVIIEKDIEADADEEFYHPNKEKSKDQKAEEDDTDDDINITSRDNTPIILIVSGLFLLSLLIVGGYKGLKTLITLLFSAGLIAFVLVPTILTGINVISTAIGIAIICAIFGILISNGFNIKSICAALGVTFSLLLAGALSAGVISIAEITSIDSKEGLILLSEYPNLNFSGILTASVIISTLGALISIGIAIANYVIKIKNSHDEYSFSKLFKKGTSAGKEAVGTMVSTLIFAYIGIGLPLLILAFNIPFIKFINLGVVITELSAAIVGGIAIILCSPITSAITALIITKMTKRAD